MLTVVNFFPLCDLFSEPPARVLGWLREFLFCSGESFNRSEISNSSLEPTFNEFLLTSDFFFVELL